MPLSLKAMKPINLVVLNKSLKYFYLSILLILSLDWKLKIRKTITWYNCSLNEKRDSTLRCRLIISRY